LGSSECPLSVVRCRVLCQAPRWVRSAGSDRAGVQHSARAPPGCLDSQRTSDKGRILNGQVLGQRTTAHGQVLIDHGQIFEAFAHFDERIDRARPTLHPAPIAPAIRPSGLKANGSRRPCAPGGGPGAPDCRGRRGFPTTRSATASTFPQMRCAGRAATARGHPTTAAARAPRLLPSPFAPARWRRGGSYGKAGPPRHAWRARTTRRSRRLTPIWVSAGKPRGGSAGSRLPVLPSRLNK